MKDSSQFEVPSHERTADNGAVRREVSSGPADGEEISLISMANVLLRYRGLILFLVVLVGLLAGASKLLAPRTYMVTASFLPQGRRAPSNLAGLAAQFGVNVPGADGGQSPAFYVSLVKSGEILGAVVDSALAYGQPSGLPALLRVRDSAPTLRRDALIRRLRDRLNASADTKSGLVSLSLTTTNANDSYDLANRILRELNRFNLESRQSQAAAERRFTERRVEQVTGELRAAENRLQSFLQSNRDYAGSPELRFQYDRLERELSLRQQLYSTLIQALEQARIEEVRDTPLFTLVERPILPARPESRGVVLVTALGLVLGLVLGVVGAFVRDWLKRTPSDASDELLEFSLLRRAAFDDLRHPWRPIGRALGFKGARS